eukprot:scaffold45753_cov46-Attheya_sp.AAC.2
MISKLVDFVIDPPQLEKDQYDMNMGRMREMYQAFGGLPQYLLPVICAGREAEMTTANARRYTDILIRALSEDCQQRYQNCFPFLHIARPGVDEDGNRSSLRKDSFVEFVSPQRSRQGCMRRFREGEQVKAR